MEVEIKGHLYRIGKLPVVPDQIHIMSKIAPAFFSAGAAAQTQELMGSLLGGGEEKQEAVASSAMMTIASVIADKVSSLSPVDREYVIRACLSVVTRRSGEEFTRVISSNGRLMFEGDMNLMVVLRLVMEVIKENFGDFFQGQEGGLLA